MQRRGFTLIELIISTGIIMLVVAASIPSFLAFQSKQNLLTGAQQVRDAILEAQNYSLAPRSDGTVDGSKVVGADFYRILFTKTAPITYRIEEQNNNNLTDPSWNSDVPVKSGSLPNGVSICAVSTDQILADGPLADTASGLVYSISQLGKITKPTGTAPITITIRHKSLADQQRISVSPQTGRVDIEAITPITCD